jgi:hypothetical protein
MRTKTKSFKALAALLAWSVTHANAAVISFVDEDIPIPADYSGVAVNLETGTTSTTVAGLSGGDLNFVFAGQGFSNDADETADTPSWQPVREGTGNTDVLKNLGVGVAVGPSSTYSTGYGGSADNFVNFTPGEKGYVGFSVVLADGNDTVAYGWVEVTFQNNDIPGVIHSWAFENTGEPLAVAAIPEPTQNVLLALALAAMAMRRRRS